PYLIYVGNRRPHKDLATLLRGWDHIAEERPVDLVLTGDADPALAALAKNNEKASRLVFLGDVDHASLMRWIAGARALVHPSLCEGFGLPLLEAVRLETPVVASDASAPQVLRAHVRTFPAGDAAELVRVLEHVLDERDRAGLVRARESTAYLTWDRCAEQTAAVYRAVLAGDSSGS
ncbi:MAG: glycosyltransferase, partial [Candidatus Eremiobacteraeota bacterium]|nr:glycosyltransferase [Candidatus Eremiobacteraeota bacterium]